MKNLLDLDTYPIDQPDSVGYRDLVSRCQEELDSDGMFNLSGFLKADACAAAVSQINPVMQDQSFEHRRWHNIYFQKTVPGLDSSHPALKQVETVNHTICADQMTESIVMQVYEFAPLLRFIAEVMEKPQLYLMDDPLARANVMAYRRGEALNWHFDRSEFTTTLLLQAAEAGGEFEYRTALRSVDDPNYPGVVNLLEGKDPKKMTLKQSPGTLNVFRGINTAHRLSQVKGNAERLVAVFSYYEYPGKSFSVEDRLGFYGRAS